MHLTIRNLTNHCYFPFLPFSKTTAYPGQVGIHPIPLNWGAPTADERGPVVASRHANSIKVRNAIGAYAGSYSIYRALAAACGLIDPSHRPG